MVVVDSHEYLSEEEKRLQEDRERKRYWKKWYDPSPPGLQRQWASIAS